MNLIPIGLPAHQGSLNVLSSAAVTIDATAEATIYIGHLFWADGGSHTVDTSGSSSLGWLTGAVTFANAGTSVSIGLAAVDTATGPPARAANVADIITFDVASVKTGGGGGITGSAWQESVPTTGTKTIAHGDFIAFAVQMTTRAGADTIAVNSSAAGGNVTPIVPSVTAFIAAAYTAQSNPPNAVVTASDGTLGFFWAGSVFLTPNNSVTWNSGSATKEYGNFIKVPVPLKVYGLVFNGAFGGDVDMVLYSDPLGTPVAEKTASLDANAMGTASSNRYGFALFSSPYTTTADQPLAAIMKPGGTNISSTYVTLNAATHQAAHGLTSTTCYAVNRASGAFAAQNSSKDRWWIGLLVDAFDNGAGSGGLAANPLGGYVG
jgi:hypothetical protein